MKTSPRGKDPSLPLPALRLLAPPLRLVSAAMWKVIQQRDAVHFGKLEDTVTSLCQTVPGLLQYRHQARLTIGLRSLMILEELRRGDPPDVQHINTELDRLQLLSLPNGSRIDRKVEEAKSTFQTLIQSLLKSSEERKRFFESEFPRHYGETFMASLEKLMWEFLVRLDQLMPVPDLAQTVSWLSAAPAVLEEFARMGSQPQLLRTLLQHEKCLGHLGSASLLSSSGDSILSSLSLPLSGRVLQTLQSEPSPASSTSTRPSGSSVAHRRCQEGHSVITPVIGSISSRILCSDKTKSEMFVHVEGDEKSDCSSSSEAEEHGRRKSSLRNQRSRITDPKRKDTKQNASQEESRSCDLQESVMSRQLRVVLPRLSPEEISLAQGGRSSSTRSVCSDHTSRKRKFTELTTPNKHMLCSVDHGSADVSPCIPYLPKNPPESLSSLKKSSDEIIYDSDDEQTENVRKKVFPSQYFRTKSGTYLPTLQEFWGS